jgi:hypothetical protein
MYNIDNLLKFRCALRKMYTGLPGMLSPISCHRDGLKDQYSRTVPGDLLVENQLAVGHSAVGIAVPEFDRGEDKSIDKLQIT